MQHVLETVGNLTSKTDDDLQIEIRAAETMQRFARGFLARCVQSRKRRFDSSKSFKNRRRMSTFARVDSGRTHQEKLRMGGMYCRKQTHTRRGIVEGVLTHAETGLSLVGREASIVTGKIRQKRIGKAWNAGMARSVSFVKPSESTGKKEGEEKEASRRTQRPTGAPSMLRSRCEPSFCTAYCTAMMIQPCQTSTKNRHQLEAVSNCLGWCRSAPVNATNATAGATSDSSTTLGTINETSSGRGRVRTLAAEPRLKRSRTWRGVIEEEESADQLVDGVDIGAIEAIAEKIARTLATDNAARAAAANAAATADADDDGELLGQTPREPKAEFLQDLDMNGDGIIDAEGYDTTADGVIDSLDTTFDGKIDTRLVANSSS